MKISAIMPAFERAKLIPHSIDSLMRQKRKPDEIIIIDDGSTDDTKQVVEKLNDKYKIIRYFFRDSPLWVNPSVPLNIGIKKAKYDLIVFSLSDTVHIGETLSYIEKKHEEKDMLYLIGSKIYWIQKNVKIPEEYWNDPIKITKMDCVVDWYNGFISKDDQIVCQKDLYTSNIASCRKKYLFEVNGFDEDLTRFYGYEDSDITQRLLNLGKKNSKDGDKTSKFILEQDNDLAGIHQYHERPPAYATVGTERQRKEASKKIYNIKANNKEWGIL